MRRPAFTTALGLGLLCTAAQAQDAARGAQLYRELPGNPGVGSCLSCHGDPANNRNSVLRGAVGGGWIARTITAVGAMGYLRQHLTEADLADVSAYLATVAPAGQVALLPAPWPVSEDFGLQQMGTRAAERPILLRNLQTREISLGAVVSEDPQTFPLRHDCPLTLPPLQQCTLRVAFAPQQVGLLTSRYQVLDSGGRVLRSGGLQGEGSAAAAPALQWAAGTPALLDFDRVSVGGERTLALTLINPGMQPVNLSRLRANGAGAARFAVEAPCLDAGRLELGAPCAVTLRYRPVAAERDEAWLEMGATAGHAPTVRLLGLGEAAPAPAPPPPAPAPQPTPAPAPAASSGGGSGSPLFALALLLAAACAKKRPQAKRVGP